jgi:hypothetical protein
MLERSMSSLKLRSGELCSMLLLAATSIECKLFADDSSKLSLGKLIEPENSQVSKY